MEDIEAALTLLDGLSSKDRRTCIELMIKLLGNVVRHPDDPKYRSLKVTNKTFVDAVWRHDAGQAVMEASGWQVVGDSVQLPPSFDPTPCLNVLLSNRDVKPAASEWVEETKYLALKSPNTREEELREKALKEKEKEIAEMKKEMARKSEIARQVRAEHRLDMESRRYHNATQAEVKRFHSPAKAEL
ncbi:hypothetical protein Pcinc_031107 [Petrolisthes cinctipes]|uniref:PUB domain-containing protein n=1 Tax=Petrolisthes cinctipes TaxID=88211 RepID=A0AAE1K340_PETCI|nr:hypothetical protein Pcinc_031107 [Petrolisthes cinctipes]